MARCPFAVQKILPENAIQNRITPRAIILHTAVDSANPNSSIYGYFFRGDVTSESHFYVMNNGVIEQYMDTEIQADANVSANSFALSIETEDDGNPAQTPWKPEQMAALNKLISWCCQKHSIPRVQIASPTGSGIGWHSMWGINTATHKPNPWTTAIGKTCPGAPRIQQVPQLIQGEIQVAALDEQAVSYQTLIGRVEALFYNANGTYGPVTGKTNELAKKLEEVLTKINAPVPVEIDYDRIINGVVDKLTVLQFKAQS